MSADIRLEITETVPRLDRFLADLHPELPRAKWDAWIKAGNLKLNGEAVTKGGTKLRPGDLVEGPFPERPAPAAHLEPESIELPTLFEDARLWIVDKPAGMVVHPGPGHAGGTIVNALLGRLSSGTGAWDGEPSEEEEGEDGDEVPPTPWPGLVHRLDRYTTGCLALTKDAEAQRSLQAQFKARSVEKRYLALARDSRRLPELGSLLIDAPIQRHRLERLKMTIGGGGRPSQTRIRVLGRACGLALVECELLTGRTHQIRVHLSHIGAPLLGDPLYGGAGRWQDAAKEPIPAPHPVLHAWKLALDHPGSGARIEALAPLPEPFRALLERLGLPLPG